MRIACLVLICSLLTCGAQNSQFEGQTYFAPTNTAIEWGISVTNLPENLWVYEATPQHIPPAVFSNLLTIAELKEENFSREFSSDQKENDPDFKKFEIKNPKGSVIHDLDFYPNVCWIKSYNHARNPKDPLREGPSEKETQELGEHYMSLAGIDRSLYDPHPRYMLVDRASTETQSNIVIARGIGYSRRIDGLDEKGTCFDIEFGTTNKVLKFQYLWRNLVPVKLYPTLSTDEILASLRNGQAKLNSAADSDYYNAFHATKLKIIQFFPLYFSGLGNEKIKYEFPYAEITAEAQVGTKTVKLYFSCPLIKQNASN